jgi:hypothetical protein
MDTASRRSGALPGLYRRFRRVTEKSKTTGRQRLMIKAKTVRYHLYNFDKLKSEIIELEEQIKSLKLCEVDFHVPCIADSDGSQHSCAGSSQVEKQAIKLADNVLHMKKRLFYKRCLLHAIKSVIHYLPEDGVDWKILKMRYFEHKKWTAIAEHINYAEYYLKRRDEFLVSEIISAFEVRKK